MEASTMLEFEYLFSLSGIMQDTIFRLIGNFSYSPAGRWAFYSANSSSEMTSAPWAVPTGASSRISSGVIFLLPLSLAS